MPESAIGTSRLSLAAERRRLRLFGAGSFSTWLCADVGMQVGPPGRTRRLDDIEPLLGLGFDGLMLSQAAIERFDASLAVHPERGLVVRLDWCGQWRALSPHDEAVGVDVSTVEQAAASGADGVIQYVLLGASDPVVEADYVSRAAETVRRAHASGLACILEPLLRGGNVAGKERLAEYQTWGIRTAVELGADAVKIEAPLEPDVVLTAADVPVLVASTPPFGDAEAVTRSEMARAAGARGVAYSADVFNSPDPGALMDRLIDHT